MVGLTAVVVLVTNAGDNARERARFERNARANIVEFARDIGQSAWEFRERTGEAASRFPSVGAVDVPITVQDRSLEYVPDDITIIVCRDIRRWWDISDLKGNTAVIAATSPRVFGSSIVLYDGIRTVSVERAPEWLANGNKWTKADLSPGVKVLSFDR